MSSSETMPSSESTMPSSESTMSSESLDSAEFECTVCLNLLFDPTTTICGHSFCKACFQSCMASRSKCPVCRHVIHCTNPSTNVSLAKLLQAVFPLRYAAREREHAALRRQATPSPAHPQSSHPTNFPAPTATAVLPMFVLDPMLPGQRIFLNVFETRYRNMLRRCLVSSTCAHFSDVPSSQ
jgi:hypothetical protein